VCVDNYIKNGIFWKIFLRQKFFPEKFLAEKNVTDFFSKLEIKKIFKILKNIILDFSFLKKQ
jgi:hypothetical protein